jgi:DNA repair ATPase RecN
VDRLSEKEAEVTAKATSLLETLDEEVFEPLKSAQSWLDSAYAVALGVGKLSEAVVSSKYAASHEDALGVAMARQLQDASENLVEVLSNLKEIRQRLADIRDDVRSTRRIAVMIVARFAQVEKRMANLCERIERYHARVVELKEEIAVVRGNLHWWTMLGAVLAASLLAWLAVSQIGMVLHGWSLVKRRLE